MEESQNSQRMRIGRLSTASSNLSLIGLIGLYNEQKLLDRYGERVDRVLDEDRLLFPADEQCVHRHSGQNDDGSQTSAHRIGEAREHGDEDGTQNVERRPDQMHLDRSVQFRVLPSQIRQRTDRQTDRQPGRKANVVL